MKLSAEKSEQFASDFSQVTQIQRHSFWGTMAGCKKTSKYKRMLKRAESAVENDLDLVTFYKRQRIHSLALLTLLNVRQRFMINKLSVMPIRESSG